MTMPGCSNLGLEFGFGIVIPYYRGTELDAHYTVARISRILNIRKCGLFCARAFPAHHKFRMVASVVLLCLYLH